MLTPRLIWNYEPFINKAIEAFDPEDVSIAGGAVRDTLFGKPVKDVDLYIRYVTTPLKNKFIKEHSLEKKSKDEYDETDFDVWHDPKKPDIDIIFHRGTIDNFIKSSFDCSICEVWYNFKHGLSYTENFDKGRDEKRIYIYRDRCSSHLASKHLERVLDKYTDWKWEAWNERH